MDVCPLVLGASVPLGSSDVLGASVPVGSSDVLGASAPLGSSDVLVAVTEENRLELLQIDSTTNTRVKCVPLKQNCIAVGAQAASQTLLYLTIPRYTETNETALVQLTDPSDFSVLHALPMKLTEYPTCVTSGALFQQPQPPQESPYYVVGTSFILPTESEPSSGRLLVMKVVGEGKERRLQLVAEQMLTGGCLAAAICRGKIVVGVNGELQVYDLDPASLSLSLLHSELGSILITQLSVDEAAGTIAVGDLLHSVSVFRLTVDCLSGKQMARLEFSSCESVRRHVTALGRASDGRVVRGANMTLMGDANKTLMGDANTISEDNAKKASESDAKKVSENNTKKAPENNANPDKILVGDVNGNLAIMREVKEDELDKSNPQKRLEAAEWFHLGDQINQFARVPSATQGVQSNDGSVSDIVFDTLFFTVSGRIGWVGAVSDEEYALLRAIEQALEKVRAVASGHV